MARKLKTYVTSAGFFDLAVAAPSMKAALAAWGSKSNLFQHGFAKESDEPKVVAATMAKPGVVLRRPVGSTGAFSEHAALPKDLAGAVVRAERKPAKPAAKATAKAKEPADCEAARRAALAFEKEEKRRESERRKEEQARAKERERRERATAAAEAALEDARQEHEARVAEIERERAAVDKKSEAEEARWKKKREQLQEALRSARSVSHLRLV